MERTEEMTESEIELQKRLSDFTGEPPQAQRRWSNPRPRSRAGSNASNYSPRPLSDTELGRLATTIATDTTTASTSPYRDDNPIVRIERVEVKLGEWCTKHQLLQETVVELQNRIIALERDQKIPARGDSNACCVLF